MIETREDIIKILDEIASLPNNWDGEGAKGALPHSIRKAKLFLNEITTNPNEIFLTNKRHIIFKWWEEDFRLMILFKGKSTSKDVDVVIEDKGDATTYHCKDYRELIKLINLLN